ncbi:diacylglycerol kinase [Paenibacillus darwinianus]|uniref:Diacylglycerol kinase n=1 Tax=Paenibacillus darwinianus TaxID=1380763 RepID=A0A9W5S405_9BACL|nr:diacylglycerol kinase family protein [Paenibacillus darwinianus]EXX91907.1 diacylglycerol kinase [Paenibacillus darwinianus]EXX92314.1 diacylglycerol kinase [Paenibacillus darwinianus]EXX92746.1 diacylglycerol kinase [Paenibacillus darwinianus]
MRRFFASFRYAGRGIAHALRTECNLRVHVCATAAVCLAAALLGLSRIEWAAVLGACALVITAELVNTAVERLVDLATQESHPLAESAKDTAAGAVLAAAFFAVVIGLLIFGPHVWRLLTDS